MLHPLCGFSFRSCSLNTSQKSEPGAVTVGNGVSPSQSRQGHAQIRGRGGDNTKVLNVNNSHTCMVLYSKGHVCVLQLDSSSSLPIPETATIYSYSFHTYIFYSVFISLHTLSQAVKDVNKLRLRSHDGTIKALDFSLLTRFDHHSLSL